MFVTRGRTLYCIRDRVEDQYEDSCGQDEDDFDEKPNDNAERI